MKKVLIAVSALAVVLIAGCNRDSQIASNNLSKKADMFELNRRIVFYNGITDTYMLTVEGRCSIKADTAGKKLDVTCKTGDTSYKKHFLGLSDNVTYFAEQLESVDVSTYHYKVIFKPQSILPDVDLKTSIN